MWVAVLGLVVFYLYGIIGFALMRSMFKPADLLYCDTLWQCTITVIRYGLIGDLFEVSCCNTGYSNIVEVHVMVWPLEISLK